ncbi:IS5/IS1182 family transposase, partial [Streptomyces sp. NPDC051909]
ARDYETRPTRSEAMIHIAMTDLAARRLTSENTISWRDPKKAAKQPISG